MPKQFFDKELIKNNLVEAFLALTREKPMQKISVGQITAKAGCARPTFYSYFKNIGELNEYAEDFLRPSLGLVQKYWRSVIKNMDIDGIATDIKNFLVENNRKLSYKDSPLAAKAYKKEFFDKLLSSFHSIAGKYNEAQEEKFHLLLTYHLHGFFNIIVEYTDNPGDITIDEFSRLLANMHIYGLSVILQGIKSRKWIGLQEERQS